MARSRSRTRNLHDKKEREKELGRKEKREKGREGKERKRERVREKEGRREKRIIDKMILKHLYIQKVKKLPKTTTVMSKGLQGQFTENLIG